jgi:hypothetical protein
MVAPDHIPLNEEMSKGATMMRHSRPEGLARTPPNHQTRLRVNLSCFFFYYCGAESRWLDLPGEVSGRFASSFAPVSL